ncbi:MAG: calcium-binding protein, partial [Candidatus Puniceispirillales bacterium WSBS_2018_MAG_OTU23]
MAEASLALNEDGADLDWLSIKPSSGTVVDASKFAFTAITEAGGEFASKLEFVETKTPFGESGEQVFYSYSYKIKLKDGESVEEIPHEFTITVHNDGDYVGVFSIAGEAEPETIHGDSSDNTIIGNSGNDHIYGNEGHDTIFGRGGVDHVSGNIGNDQIHGGRGDDVIYGNGGDDTLRGGSGNDVIYGGDGDDYLDGSYGDDYLDGGAGRDRIYGGLGDDELHGGAVDDELNGGAGDDVLVGYAGHDGLYGGIGDDHLDGGDGDDFMGGGGGDDRLDGGDGDDWIGGARGDDTLNGGVGNDWLFGGSGNDKLNGGDGDDWMSGGKGRDKFVVKLNSGVNIITDFVPGEDRIHIDVAFADLQFSKEHYTSEIEDWPNNPILMDLVISANDAVIAVLEDFAGSLTSDDFLFLIEGTKSHDTLFGSNGNDIIYGYDGQDHVSSGAGNDRIYGGDGNDVIFAGVGDDHLDGGNGDDHLNGQEDKDIFVLNFDYTGKDTVFGFEQGIDKIHIKKAHYDQIVKTDGSINIVEGVIKDADDNDVLVLQGFEGTLTKADFSISQRLSYESVINNIGTVDENDEGADIDGLRFTLNDNIGIDDLTLVGVFEGDKAVSDKLRIKDYADGVYGLKLKDGESFDYEQRDYIYLRLEHEGATVGGGTLLIDINDVAEVI